MSNPNISKLTPAAARLLLAFMAAGPAESYDDVVQQSGIHSCLTLASAKQQLRNLGFVAVGPNGEENIAFYPDDQTAERENERNEREGTFVSVVSRALKTTKARGM